MIRVVERPLSECAVEAVLRPVRTDWAPVTRSARRLEREAGSRWVERCSAQGDLILGSAAITDAGELPASFVIHVAVCSPDHPPTPRTVTRALQNGLRRADEWDVRQLAMPLLGTGPGSLDPEDACRIMDPQLREFCGRSGDAAREVRIAADDPASLAAAREAWTPDS